MRLSHRSDYGTRRAQEYPSIEDQLDMLWHGMNNGDIPKMEPFYSTIAEVKAKYPKPSDLPKADSQ